MQSWVIILNIDDLNGSVDGQIIEDIKSENCISHVKNRPGPDSKTGLGTRAQPLQDSNNVTIFYI